MRPRRGDTGDEDVASRLRSRTARAGAGDPAADRRRPGRADAGARARYPPAATGTSAAGGGLSGTAPSCPPPTAADCPSGEGAGEGARRPGAGRGKCGPERSRAVTA